MYKSIRALGFSFSQWGANVAASPLSQIAVILVCAFWFAVKLPVEVLTAALSILAITLTQMVPEPPGRARGRPSPPRRRLHAKIDELVHAMGGARDELVRSEDREEDEIEALRDGMGDNVRSLSKVIRKKAG